MMVTIKNGIMQIKRYPIPEKIGNSAIACAVPVLERFIAPQENPTAPPNITIETPTIASYPNAFAITSPTAANGIQELKPAGIQINANIIQNLKRIDWSLFYILK